MRRPLCTCRRASRARPRRPRRDIDDPPQVQGIDGALRPVQAHRLGQQLIRMRRKSSYQRYRRLLRPEQIDQLLFARLKQRRKSL